MVIFLNVGDGHLRLSFPGNENSSEIRNCLPLFHIIILIGTNTKEIYIFYQYLPHFSLKMTINYSLFNAWTYQVARQ